MRIFTIGAWMIVLTALLLAGCGNGSSGPYDVGDEAGATTTGHTMRATEFGEALCSRCHTDQGARAYIGVVNGTEDPDALYSVMAGREDIANPASVTCGTCHVMDSMALLGELAVGLPGHWSRQFKTCTACHQLLTASDGLHAAFHNGVDNNGVEWRTERIITDTHYDDPTTPQRDARGSAIPDTGGIEGYVLNTTSLHDPLPGNTNTGTCLDCHDQHDTATVAINRQWAESGHGGHIGEAGVVTDDEAAAWVHYDFKAENRQSCQRCHTATGFRNFANGPAIYNAANNVFTATGQQAELLYCWACHTDHFGTVRDPGVFNTTVPYAQPAPRINAVPDMGGSNVCMACHAGRSSGTSGITLSADDFSNKKFVNSHYLPAGGIVFRTVGYEYAGQNYDDVPYYGHRNIGTSLEPETGTGGPCVGCHLRTEKNHDLLPVEKDGDGYIVAIPANEAICSNCHKPEPYGDFTLHPEDLNEEEEGYHEALTALEDALRARGFDFLGGHPYFANTNWITAEDPTGKKNMGAAFNFNTLHHEPGAYAHNSVYTKRLIFDSTNWMEDAAINNTIDLTGYPAAHGWMNGGDPITAVTRP